VAYVWWYDREGAIQSHGINFVQDLPYFLVLLLAFQRFTMDDWGMMSAFRVLEGHSEKQCSFSFPATATSPAVDVAIDKMANLHDHYGMVGRATRVACASSQSPHPRNDIKTLGGLELVLKIYWPEASRIPEGQIIEAAAKVGEHNDHVMGHLPDLICSHDPGYSTSVVRKALGIVSNGPRILRVILFRKLYPITDFIGEKFWKAFWECFRCEYFPAFYRRLV
jgi:Fungal protein kinase